MLTHVADTLRYLQENNERMREAADHLARVADRIQHLAVLDEHAKRLDVIATMGGKASVETTARTPRRRPRPKTKKTRKDT